MGTTVTVTTTINRTYLKNKTKDEIIDLLLYILDTRCEADAKVDAQAAEIERLQKALDEIANLWPIYINSSKPRPLMVAIDMARKALEANNGMGT